MPEELLPNGLAQRLKESRGKAYVIVHPFFHEYYSEYRLKRDYLEYKARLLDFIKRTVEKKNPLVVFEETEKIEETKKQLKKAEIDPSALFFMPFESNRYADQLVPNKNERWLALTKTISKAHLGGSYFFQLNPKLFPPAENSRHELEEKWEKSIAPALRRKTPELSDEEIAAVKKHYFLKMLTPITGCVGRAYSELDKLGVKANVMPNLSYGFNRSNTSERWIRFLTPKELSLLTSARKKISGKIKA